MIEDAKALGDGPAFEPTKRLRGLAAVVAETEVMSKNEESVSDRGKIYALASEGLNNLL